MSVYLYSTTSFTLTDCRLDNPLQRYGFEELDDLAAEFARQISADEELFKRAARVAWDPPSWKNVDGLTPEEHSALETEKGVREPKAFRKRWQKRWAAFVHGLKDDDSLASETEKGEDEHSPSGGRWETFVRRAHNFRPRHLRLLCAKGGFWYQTQALRNTTVTLCLSAIVQGWIQSVSNGANQSMPEDLGLKGPNSEHPNSYAWEDHGIYRFAGINASTYLSAASCGCWLSDPIQSKFLGRRGAIFASACICFIAAIGAARSSTWQSQLAWRAVLGAGLGTKASVSSDCFLPTGEGYHRRLML